VLGRGWQITIAAFVLAYSLPGCGSLPEDTAYKAPAERPAHWAQVLGSGESSGSGAGLSKLNNCFRVDAHLIRCGQPSAADFSLLAGLGVTRVLNLREYHDDARITRDERLTLMRLPLDAAEVTPTQLRQAVALIKANPGVTLVHCWHGSDRTGAVVAAYRILSQGWSKDEAIREFIYGGYGFHPIYWDLVHSLEQL